MELIKLSVLISATFAACSAQASVGNYSNDGLHMSSCSYKPESKLKCKAGSGLVCVDTFCSCPYPEHQVYDETKGSCISNVNGPCTVKSKSLSFPCTDNAKCLEDPQDPFHHRCQCQDGYVESSDRKCDIAHGFPCHENTPCDRLGDLACTPDGKCGCRNDFQVWNAEQQKCLGAPGASCAFAEAENCVGGQECKGNKRNVNEVTGICGCPPGLKWDGKQCTK